MWVALNALDPVLDPSAHDSKKNETNPKTNIENTLTNGQTLPSQAWDGRRVLETLAVNDDDEWEAKQVHKEVPCWLLVHQSDRRRHPKTDPRLLRQRTTSPRRQDHEVPPAQDHSLQSALTPDSRQLRLRRGWGNLGWLRVGWVWFACAHS